MKLGLITLGLCLLTACDTQSCTEIAVASVSLHVVSAETGEDLDDVAVRFSIDGGAEQQPDAREDDGAFILDYEETGTFAVTIEAAGFETVMTDYKVVLDEDGCHPLGVSDTIELAMAEVPDED